MREKDWRGQDREREAPWLLLLAAILIGSVVLAVAWVMGWDFYRFWRQTRG